MPELPEVETQRRRVQRWLKGRRLAEVTVADDPVVLAGLSPRGLADALRGRRVKAVRRRGKHLWLELDRRPWLAFHFGMTGWFSFYRREERAAAVLEDRAGRGRRPPSRLHGSSALRPDPSAAGSGAGGAHRPARLRSAGGAAPRARAGPPSRAPQGAAQGGAPRPIALRRRRELGRGRGPVPGAPQPAASGVVAQPGRGPSPARQAPRRHREGGRGRRGQRPVPGLMAVPYPLGPPGGRGHRARRGHPPRDDRRTDDGLGPLAPALAERSPLMDTVSRRARRRCAAAATCEGGFRGGPRTPIAMVCECPP